MVSFDERASSRRTAKAESVVRELFAALVRKSLSRRMARAEDSEEEEGEEEMRGSLGDSFEMNEFMNWNLQSEPQVQHSRGPSPLKVGSEARGSVA